MKSFIQKILNSKVITTILIVGALFLLGSWAWSEYQSLKTDLRVAKQNQSALRDSLRVKKNKIGNLEFSKQILIAQRKADIEALNYRLSKVLEQVDERGKIINQLSETVANVKTDTIIVYNTELVELPDNVRGFKWSHEKIYDNQNSRFLSGITKFTYDEESNALKPLETLITRDEINFNIVQGLRTVKGGKIEMFATSNHPNFEVTELNSVLIDPAKHPALREFVDKKRLNFGVYAGFGATMNTSNSVITVGPQIGGGLTYIIW